MRPASEDENQRREDRCWRKEEHCEGWEQAGEGTRGSRLMRGPCRELGWRGRQGRLLQAL